MEGGRERRRKGEAPIVCARKKGRRSLLGSSLSEDLTLPTIVYGCTVVSPLDYQNMVLVMDGMGNSLIHIIRETYVRSF